MYLQLLRRRFFFAPDDGGSGSGDGADNAGGAGKGDGEEKKSFTQKELNEMFGERAKQAASKAVTDLLAGLGVKDADELKGRLAKAKEAEEAQLSELEKAKKLAEDEKARADAAETARVGALAKAQEKLMRAAVLDAASKAGFHDPNDAWLFIDRAKIKAKDDDTFEGVKEAVEAVVKAKPHLAGEKKRAGGTPGRQVQQRKGAGDGEPNQPRRPALRL